MGTQTAITTYAYDRNGNVTTKTEYDWIPAVSGDSNHWVLSLPGSLGTLVRTTTNTFFNATGAATGCASVVADSNGYWNHQSTIAPLNELNAAVVTGNGSGTTAFTYDANGNVHTRTAYKDAAATMPLTTTYNYSASRNLTSVTGPSPNNSFTQYAYNDGCPVPTYVSSITDPLNHVTTQTWDCTTGLLLNRTDPNNINTVWSLAPSNCSGQGQTACGYDVWGRVLKMQEAVGTLDQRTTSYSYAATDSSAASLLPITVVQTEDLLASGDGLLTTTTRLNQLGEAYSVQRGDVTSQHLSTAVPVPSDTFTYVADSNPFFSTSDATMGWIRKKFDQNGRLAATDYFSGAGAPSPWGTNSVTTGGQTVSYLNNTTTFTDEASKSRKQTIDGLGRLTSVIEDPGGLNYTTNYTYDFGDRLTNVAQTDSVEGAQSRTFVYDSAGRLTSATNPETGLISYQYDGNGNVTQRSDPRVTTNINYDAGNRIKTKTYSDSTPAVTYCYDALPSSPGVCATVFVVGSGFVDRETEVYSSASRTDYLTFDSLGRVKTNQQVTGTLSPFVFNYTYTPQSALATEQYPSGRTITYNFDPVAGRVTTVALGSLNYASSIGYWANGSIKQMNLGNTLVEQSCLNTRMEPLAIRLGTLSTTNCANSSDTLNVSYTYASSDNGNVLTQTINRPGFTAAQSYTATPYDGVNRLKKVQETGPGTTWSESYSYDAFGNRWVTNPTPPTTETPIAQSWYSTSNKITGWGYDGSGNVTSVLGMQRAFTYDAENRQNTATINTTPIAYVYDGDGRRVQKVICPIGTANCTATVSGAVTTMFVYDAQGQLAAEYGPASDSGTRYVTADHLGSTRVLTDASGVVTKCYDYYPFGGEIPVGVDNRPSCYGTNTYPAAPDLISEKFTGKERDAETGLDNFLARYYSGAQGRFTSPDEPFADQDEDNPQSWNLYSYGRNNPLRNIDPTGRCSQGAGGYVDEGSGLFPGPCSGGQIGEQKAGDNSVTVGVGRDEANLIMLQGIGENLSSPHQWATIVSGAGQGAATLFAPLPTAIAQCAAASATGGQCSKTSVAMAAIPFGPGRLARILRRHSALSVAKNVSKFAKGLDDAAHVESMVESALASPTRATGYADGAAYVDANLGVTIGTDPAGKRPPQLE